MQNKNSLLCAAILLLISLAACSGPSENLEDETSLVLHNGKIWTGSDNLPWADWVLIEGDEIARIGQGNNFPTADQSIDLKGRLTLPGFNDSHVHFASAGSLLLGINLLDVNDDEAFVNRVRETTERLPTGSWITRGDWGAYEAWNMGSEGNDRNEQDWQPRRKLIDAITPDHPVLVTKYDRTEGMANALALDFLGIESEDGILKGDILTSALRQVPESSFERKLAEAKRALEECAKWGVTTVQDMSPLDRVDIYNYLLERDSLITRINFSPSRLSEIFNMMNDGWVIDWGQNPAPAGNEYITFGTIKSHIDGIMGGRTARFFQPYTDNTIENYMWRGGWREFSRNLPQFKKMLIQADSGGIQLRVHAIGDEANSILLDILDTLDQVNGARDRRFRLVHAQVIAEQDFERFAGRNIIAEVQPYHVTDDMRWMEERIGYERCKGAYAFKTLQDAGCQLAFGSDWPGTNASYYPINPLYGLYAAVTRQTVNGQPETGWFPEQRINLESALKAYTTGSAFATFEEDVKGKIEPGMLADIVVVDTDLFETEPSSWLQARFDYTIVGGKVVYQRQ